MCYNLIKYQYHPAFGVFSVVASIALHGNTKVVVIDETIFFGANLILNILLTSFIGKFLLGLNI